jgi:hypothetical protein
VIAALAADICAFILFTSENLMPVSSGVSFLPVYRAIKAIITQGSQNMPKFMILSRH